MTTATDSAAAKTAGPPSEAAVEQSPRRDNPTSPAVAARTARGDQPAERVFSTSVVVSGVRCVLAYVIFPWVLPAAGIASGVGSGAGLVIGSVALLFNVLSIRRFQRSGHRYRWLITALNGGIIVLLSILMVIDVNDLFGAS